MKRLGWCVLLMWPVLRVLAGPAYAACSDPKAAATVRASLATACPCTAATNHGQYVSCINRQLRQAVPAELPANCKGAVTRCAARSTCGKKSGFVTCSRCEPGTCTNGFCDDLTTACTSSATCPGVVTHCSTKASATLCPGVVGTGSCCDATCPVTSVPIP